MSWTLRPLLCVTALVLPVLAEAQTEPREPDRDPLFTEEVSEGARILGRVTDLTTEQPVSSARVTFRWIGDEPGSSWEGVSGEGGGFLTPRLRLGHYEVRVEMIGFGELTERVNFDEAGDFDLQVDLVPQAIPLEPVFVVVRRRSRLESSGFHERRNVGIGHFLTRAQIEERTPSRVSDLFYFVPGARVVSGSGGASATSSVRLRGGCTPLLVLDGMPLSFPARLDDLLGVPDIEAVEVYHGPTGPVRFSGFTTCGTILVWTRESGLREGSPFSWRRMLVGGGLFGAILLLAL